MFVRFSKSNDDVASLVHDKACGTRVLLLVILFQFAKSCISGQKILVNVGGVIRW